MLDKLIESKNAVKSNRRLSGFLASAFTAVFSILAVGLIYSLFNYNLAISGSDLEISALLAPMTDFESEPLPELLTKQKRHFSEKTVANSPSRQENIRRPDESPVKSPTTISVTPMTRQARPKGAFIIERDANPAAFGSEIAGRSSSENTTGIKNNAKPPIFAEKDEIEQEPEIKQPKKSDSTVKSVVVSKGVINGQAKNLIKPAYPQAARTVGASGEVRVQVAIDEEGRVISAIAVGGHPLLKAAAVNAARLSTFTPTFLSDRKVKVTGVIIYNFTR